MSADGIPNKKHAEYAKLKPVSGVTTAENLHANGKRAPRPTKMVTIMDNEVKTRTVDGNMKHP